MNVYQKVIEHYGATAQKEKAIEEMQELIAEIQKELEYGKYDLTNMLGEIADVANMLVQMCLIHGFTRDDLNQKMKSKMERTLRRIEEEKADG